MNVSTLQAWIENKINDLERSWISCDDSPEALKLGYNIQELYMCSDYYTILELKYTI